MEEENTVQLNEVGTALETIRDFVMSPDATLSQLQVIREGVRLLNDIISHKIMTALMADKK